MRTISKYVNLQRWFPANDVVAANVARLCILKEDLEIEYRGLLEKGIQSLDKNGIPWRKLYFLRNIFRTMLEIHSAVHSLKSNADFKKAISNQPESLRKAFDSLSSEMTSTHPVKKHIGMQLVVMSRKRPYWMLLIIFHQVDLASLKLTQIEANIT